MKTKNGIVHLIVVTFFILTVVALPLKVSAVEIRISSIDDSYIGKEVTVSGVIVAISSNIEPSTSTEVGIQTYEPGDTGILTIDDGTDRIFVSSDPRLLEKFYKGQRVIVTGIYAGKGGIAEGKGIIYADSVSPSVAPGYKDVTVKELKDFPAYYYADSVRIQGNVTRIEITPGKTELVIDDNTGTMDVRYGAEMEDIRIGDEVIVEGRFYRTTIYAFTVKAPMPEPEVTPEPSPSPTSPPAPSPTVTPSPSPTPIVEEGSMPLYLILLVIALVAVAGVFIAFRVRDWLMIRRYAK
ncbi:MAG: hypothetical protein QMD80_02960 [archaeon]|nr:hypothetical protein [archaeon]